jgi:hypothetical protein
VPKALLRVVAVGALVSIALAAQAQKRSLEPADKSAGAFDRGRKWAILIGVDQYDDPSIPTLRACSANSILLGSKTLEMETKTALTVRSGVARKTCRLADLAASVDLVHSADGCVRAACLECLAADHRRFAKPVHVDLLWPAAAQAQERRPFPLSAIHASNFAVETATKVRRVSLDDEAAAKGSSGEPS